MKIRFYYKDLGRASHIERYTPPITKTAPSHCKGVRRSPMTKKPPMTGSFFTNQQMILSFFQHQYLGFLITRPSVTLISSGNWCVARIAGVMERIYDTFSFNTLNDTALRAIYKPTFLLH
jgi:hypothetical protein